MKIISLIITVVLLCGMALGQKSQTKPNGVQEPEYIGVFMFLDTAKGELKPLERSTPETKAKVKALGLGGAEGFLEFPGEKSTIRFKSTQDLVFIVRVGSQQVDPQTIIQFFVLESKKGKRRLQMAKYGLGKGGSTTSKSAISFNVAKYGESSYKVVPANPLSPGEYVLSGHGTQDGFCFGIDADSEIKK